MMSVRSQSAAPNPRLNGPRMAYLIMGLPGCGKSTVKRDRFGDKLELLGSDFEVQCSGKTGDDRILDVDPDRLKPFHSMYSAREMTDREDSAVHSWSVRTTARLVDKICQAGTRDFVVDSSGANPRWMLDRILEARGKYKVHLIFVDCPLEIALVRNRDRGAACDGWVPEDVVIDKAGKVHATLQKLIGEVDVVERVWAFDNDTQKLEQARLDLYLYPAPRKFPPPRPEDDDYNKVPSGACPPSTQLNSRRVLRLANWKRNDHTAECFRRRLQWIDRVQESRESFIIQDVFNGDTAPHLIVFERNKFPYHMPDRVEHWTLWAYQQLTHRTICDYVENHIRIKRPDVVTWNYDDNEGRKTIQIDHVHVYMSTRHDEISMLRPNPETEIPNKDYSESTAKEFQVLPAVVELASEFDLDDRGEEC